MSRPQLNEDDGEVEQTSSIPSGKSLVLDDKPKQMDKGACPC